MDRKYLKQLVDEVERIETTDIENEYEWEITFNKRLEALTKDLDETIEYLDTCSKKELDWMSEVFEELSEHFKSQRLIDCVERNVTRFDDPELQDELRMELEYMRLAVSEE